MLNLPQSLKGMIMQKNEGLVGCERSDFGGLSEVEEGLSGGGKVQGGHECA